MNSIPHNDGRAESLIETECLPATSNTIERAAELLRDGRLVAVPTETVYGLAANALDPRAVAAIFEAKGRPADNPLIVHVGSAVDSVAALMSGGFVQPLRIGSPQRTIADRLIHAFWPGPLTIVLPRGPTIPESVTARQATAAFRMPAHRVMLELLQMTQLPLAAPSANRSNRISPTAASHVLEELGGRVPMIIDGGRCDIGVESTIVSIDVNGGVTMLRPGGLAVEAIAAVIAAPLLPVTVKNSEVVVPGMQSVHYAPAVPLTLVERDDDILLADFLAKFSALKTIGIVVLQGEPACPVAWAPTLRGVKTIVTSLGDDGDGCLAARHLFAALRDLDRQAVDLIVVEAPSQVSGGLWQAVKDRLRRAAAAAAGGRKL